MKLFDAKDFRVFSIPGFEERMTALAERVRPKLTAIGEALAPPVASIVDRPVFAHVALHARRTVHPPDDTWTAIGGGRRGYKKDVHFKVAVSENCVRLLFEVGPEYYDKTEWALRWRRDAGVLRNAVGAGRRLSWFENEHDEAPARAIAALSDDEWIGLGNELTRRRHGQLVLGRRIDRAAFLAMTPDGFKRTAVGTFRRLGPLFTLHSARELATVR